MLPISHPLTTHLQFPSLGLSNDSGRCSGGAGSGSDSGNSCGSSARPANDDTINGARGEDESGS